MKLIADWKTIWHKLWSVRLSLVAALASAIEAAWQAYITGQPPLMALLTMVIALAAAFSRIVAQPGLLDG